MYSKIVVLAAFIAIAAALDVHHDQHHEEQYAPAHYEFKYGVDDPNTGDKKSHTESREGDVTKGEYSLVEADGTIRTVKYTVDKDSGFIAEVVRSGQAKQAAPAHYAPLAVAHAPVAVHHAPIAVHHTPIAVHHAPIAVHHVPIAVHHAPVAVHHVPLAVHHAPIVASLGHQGHASTYSNVVRVQKQHGY